MKKSKDRLVSWAVMGAAVVLAVVLLILIWIAVPAKGIRWLAVGLVMSLFLLLALYAACLRRRVAAFGDQLCDSLDNLIAGKPPSGYHPYEDSLIAKTQGKLLQYYDIMSEGQERNRRDKIKLQEIVSDISHQVKTPIANAQMFINILKQPGTPNNKKEEFIRLLDTQISKLDFLMQSLIKMSRLETGTFLLKINTSSLYDTIAQAVSGVWLKADQKDITLDVDCDSEVYVRHDTKWTAEALMNLLDNAVKYTPPGGTVTVSVHPWQFYTKIDITDTGMGVHEENYNRIFKRFYRAQEAASQEGLGLGLYLAQSIIQLQKGYISVKSVPGSGSTFSVHLLSQ